MRNDRDVIGNLKSVEYMRKMVLRSVTQEVLGVLGFFLPSRLFHQIKNHLSNIFTRFTIHYHISIKNFYPLVKLKRIILK